MTKRKLDDLPAKALARDLAAATRHPGSARRSGKLEPIGRQPWSSARTLTDGRSNA